MLGFRALCSPETPGQGDVMNGNPHFFKRLLYSLLIFVRFLFDGDFARRVMIARQVETEPEPSLPTTPERVIPERTVVTAPAPTPVVESKPAPPTPTPTPAHPDSAPALHLLALLQREGRLVDFLQENISSFGDADVGAAARVVHDGCRKVLGDYFVLEPVRPQSEGTSVVVEPGFEPASIRLTGNVTGQPPFSGTLRHHGWRAAEVKLPAIPVNHDPRIVAPAEVEL